MYLNLTATNSARAHSQAGGSTLAVLLFLCFHADEQTWTADPSKETLVEESGFSLPTVKRALKELVELGEVEIVERPVKGQKHKTNLYRIKLPRDERRERPKTVKPTAKPAAPKTAAAKAASAGSGYRPMDKLAVLRSQAVA